MLDRIRAFLGLPSRDRGYLILAWLSFFGTEWRLRTRSLQACWSACEVRREAGGWTGRWVPEDTARAAWLLDVAERHHPLRPRCLRTSLTLAWLLAGDRRASTLHIGVARPPGGLAAHAWLEVDGHPVTEIPADVTYLPLEPVPREP